MSKKTPKHKKLRRISDDDDDPRIARALQNLKHKDLQRECILRGMDSQEMVNANHHSLVSFFYKNFDAPQDIHRLAIHDSWVESQLLKLPGYTKGKEFLHPVLKLGLSGDIVKINGKVHDDKPIKAKNIPAKENRVKAKINEVTKVRMGTKKEMTYDLAYKGVGIEEIIKQVKGAFPDANEKSLKIWQKRALKEKGAK